MSPPVRSALRGMTGHSACCNCLQTDADGCHVVGYFSKVGPMALAAACLVRFRLRLQCVARLWDLPVPSR